MNNTTGKKKIRQNPIVLSFDEHILCNKHFFSPLLVTCIVQKYVKKNIPVILVCAAYCNAKQIIKNAGKDAVNKKVTKSFVVIQNLCKLHIDTIKSNKLGKNDGSNPTKNQAKNQAKNHVKQIRVIEQIQNVQNKIEILLAGVAKLGELSEKTARIFKEYSFLLSAYLMYYVISVGLYDTAEKHVKLYKSIDEINKNKIKHAVSIVVPVVAPIDVPIDILGVRNVLKNPQNIHYDNALALCVQKIKASNLNLWTTGNGVLTANNTDVPHAKSIKNLTYNIALEVAYLGGTVLHPSALEKLMQNNVVITIYSTVDFLSDCEDFSCYNNVNLNIKYTTQISDTSKQTVKKTSTNKKHHQIILTNRSNFTICTVRSANMFEISGYLEKIFTVCATHKVSIETLTTSEISVTMTFETSYMNKDFLTQLQLLGEVRYEHNYSIINMIGQQYWENPAHIADALKSLEKTKKNKNSIKVATMSLGRNASNLSLVLQSKDTADALRILHRCLCEI